MLHTLKFTPILCVRKCRTWWFPVTKFSDYKYSATEVTIKRFRVTRFCKNSKKKWYWFLCTTTKLVSFVTTHLSSLLLCSKATNPFQKRRDNTFVPFGFYYTYMHIYIYITSTNKFMARMLKIPRTRHIISVVVTHANRDQMCEIRLFLFILVSTYLRLISFFILPLLDKTLLIPGALQHLIIHL